MNLVLIESPGKVKKFRQILGNDYEIFPTIGHCIDLPEKKISVDIKNNFKPTFQVKPDKKDHFEELRKLVKKATKIYMMTDLDREGESIIWNIKNELEKESKAEWLRATTNEITKSGILNAIEHPGTIDINKINAYLCRRILDRIVGYKTSFLTKQATGGTSAGRVQSAMLRVIAEREIEIKNFKPEEYWVLTAKFKTQKNDTYVGILDEKIHVKNEQKANEIYNAAIKGSPIITDVDSKDVQTNPYAPFVTASMVQSASTILGWGVKKTEKTAQSLYHDGHLTYTRTDSPYIAPEALTSIRSFISGNYPQSYLPKSANLYKAKIGAQEAHECCRPTDINVQSVSSGDEKLLYEMVWRRTVASQMTPGLDRRTKVITISAKYPFITNGNVRLFDGFRKIWHYSLHEEVHLPDLHKGEKCDIINLDMEQKFTSPPPRYSDASLSKKCEKEQISRPATFGNFVETLKSRKYILQKNKAFHATDLGLQVIDFLKNADMCFVDIEFTANMESLLDDIAQDKKNKEDVLNEFWNRLKSDIAKGESIRDLMQVSEYECPKCKGKLLKKHSKFGAFYSCSNWSKKDDTTCKYTAKVGDDGSPVEKQPVAPKEYASFVCNKCSGKMLKRSGRYGDFYGCVNFSSGCKATANLNGEFKSATTKKKWKKKHEKN